MKGLLFAFLPDGFLYILIMLVGIALIFGIFSRQRAFNFIGLIVLFALLSPFLYSLFDQLPFWLLLLIIVGFIFSIARVFLNTLFGRGPTDQFLGMLMYALFVLPFRLIGSLFRGRRRVI